jgi:GDSL-like Lipase/Acylhydrolase family
MRHPITRERVHQALRSTCLALFMTLATLAAIEIVLRVVDLRILREAKSERSLAYGYDAELGWAPIPNSSSSVTTERTIHAQHNSFGLRDIEFERDARPTMLFLGDSFVWGVDAEAGERFTDTMRSRISNYTTVNAGVSGYGTDQEYLWLQRLWPKIRPDVVVLIFCASNDRLDNATNIRYDGYQKPYFATAPDGTLVLQGQPVPKSRQVYIRENWLVRHLWLARVAALATTEIRHPQLYVPDPTERLVSKIREFVEAHGARLMVGLQRSDDKLIQHLQAERIPFVTFNDAEAYSDRFGAHWTPAGHKLVAERLLRLLSENNVIPTDDLLR